MTQTRAARARCTQSAEGGPKRTRGKAAGLGMVTSCARAFCDVQARVPRMARRAHLAELRALQSAPMSDGDAAFGVRSESAVHGDDSHRSQVKRLLACNVVLKVINHAYTHTL
jgi:hypothetical protein